MRGTGGKVQTKRLGGVGWGGRGGAEAVNTAVKRKEQRLGVESESKITGRAAQLSCAQTSR